MIPGDSKKILYYFLVFDKYSKTEWDKKYVRKQLNTTPGQ